MGSFRQLLLVAFMLIAALLGGTALWSVAIFDRLMAQSSEAAASALELNGAAQALAARTTSMERAARQSPLILNDSVLRLRFAQEATQARALLERMEKGGVVGPEAALWRGQLDTVAALLEGPGDALAREREVAAEFRELDARNGRLIAQTQSVIERRNRELGQRR